MEIKVTNLPTFATEAARLITSRADQPLNSLSIKDAEIVLKTWFFEAVLEIQKPDEITMTYYTRAEASRKLGIVPATLDDLVRKADIKYRWLGNRKILLEGELNSLISEENIYNPKNIKDE